jgi:superfamily II DNA or RNA helicase
MDWETKTIIFNCNIDHSKKVNEAFGAFGYPSRHLDGEVDEHARRATLLWFKNTPGAILNNIGVLTTGFDEPSLQTVIVNKSTMSLPLWLQMTGRGARPFPEKQFFTIIDMGGNALTHGDWSDSRDWSYEFQNPDKPKNGEAPTKVCVGC